MFTRGPLPRGSSTQYTGFNQVCLCTAVLILSHCMCIYIAIKMLKYGTAQLKLDTRFRLLVSVLFFHYPTKDPQERQGLI